MTAGSAFAPIAMGTVTCAAALAAGYLVVRAGDSWPLPAVVLVGTATLLLVGARRAMLGCAVAALIVGSAAIPLFKSAAFYPRFVLLGAVATVNVVAARGRCTGRARGFAVALWLLALLAAVSRTWSVDPLLSGQRALGFALLVAAVLSLVQFSWRDPEALRSDLKMVAAVGAIAVAGSMVALAAGAGWAFNGVRFRGVFENPNTIGLTSALLLPLVLGLGLEARAARRAVWGLAAVSMVAALLLSRSRASLAAAAVGLAIFALGKASRGWRSTAALSLVATGVLLVTVVGGDSLQGAADRFRDEAGRGRAEAWRVAADLWEDRPWTGWGFGTTEQVFGPRVTSSGLPFVGALVHNGFLQALLELGPLGPALVLAALWASVRERGPRAASPLDHAVVGALTAGVVVQLFESGMTSAGSIFAFTFWLIAGAALRLRSLKSAAPDLLRVPARDSERDTAPECAS